MKEDREQNFRLKDSESKSDKEFDVFKPLPLSGSIMLIIISGLSNAAGIGGGPLNTLNLSIFFSFNTFLAIPMTQVIIFGGSLMSIALKIPARHPTKNRPLIDYELVSYLTAPLLAGTSVGVILHLIFPDYLSSFLLVLLLIFMSYQAIKKGISLYKKESFIKQSSISIRTIESDKNYDTRTSQQEITTPLTETKFSTAETPSVKIQSIWGSLFIIALIYLTVFIGSLMKGGKTFDSIVGLTDCSGEYWIFISIYFANLLGITVLCGLNLIKINKKRESNNYDFDEYDPRWKKINTFKIGFVTLMTGVAAGALGIGGGLVMNPFMISMGIRPEVSSACSNFMILFSSSISFLQFFISGIINVNYMIYLFSLAVIGSFFGHFIIRAIMKRMNRPSIIIILLSVMLVLSIIGITYTGILSAVDAKDYGFKSIC